MKTYLFDTFNRYTRFSENLDVKTILCNKSWWVFNDSGEKELYIFNTDGTLIIAVSGRVTNATWQYIPANKSIVVTGNAQSYMVHPAFCDNMLLALQVDGTNQYTFLIDEKSILSTNLKTFNDLVLYFAEKEKQAILGNKKEDDGKKEEGVKKNTQAPTWYLIYEFVMVVIFSSAIICGIIRLWFWLINYDAISGITIDIISGVLGLLFTLWVKFSND
jgi:hypothetical protein